ncbi:AbrB/MazE/SpoVT family DNA-binding domain-containing protein [Candidatus Woesearchaeota archaeon]|nr:AbrB/MazE/SpoVT family DNA-binding domain-containing protein [Candidatus Woesearchaeota archaeon]
MKKCGECSGEMKEFESKTPEGVAYSYYRCSSCGEEIVDMRQLHTVAEKYRVMKRYSAKLSKWGLSLGLRIPKELVRKYNLKREKEVIIVPEKEGIRIVAT